MRQGPLRPGIAAVLARPVLPATSRVRAIGTSNTRASQHHVATNLGFTLSLGASLGTLQGLGGQGSRINDRFFLGASAFAI